MLSYAPSGNGHKDYVADEQGVWFDCHYLDNAALLHLVETADRLIAWIPENISTPIDPAIERFCDLLNDLMIVNRPAGSTPYPAQRFNVARISGEREEISRQLKRRLLVGRRQLDEAGPTILVLVFAPLEVFSCSLTART